MGAEVTVSLRAPDLIGLVAQLVAYPFNVEVIFRSDIYITNARDWAVFNGHAEVLPKLGALSGITGRVPDNGCVDPGRGPEPSLVDVS